jgi:hypothetical protein
MRHPLTTEFRQPFSSGVKVSRTGRLIQDAAGARPFKMSRCDLPFLHSSEVYNVRTTICRNFDGELMSDALDSMFNFFAYEFNEQSIHF